MKVTFFLKHVSNHRTATTDLVVLQTLPFPFYSVSEGADEVVAKLKEKKNSTNFSLISYPLF